jgi:hypothetical protein
MVEITVYGRGGWDILEVLIAESSIEGMDIINKKYTGPEKTYCIIREIKNKKNKE